MTTRGFITLEFFARVSGAWLSLGVRTLYPSADSSGNENFTRTFAMNCSGAIGTSGTNEFRVVRIGFGSSSSTDYISSFTGVTWQSDGTTPTETTVTNTVPVKITPVNG